VAAMLWPPVDENEVGKIAWAPPPPGVSVTVPRRAKTVTSKNWTVPVGVPPPVAVTVAVRVTGVPTVVGFCEDASVVVVLVSACAALNDGSKNAHVSSAALINNRQC
jgi:hypothetical protein